MVANPVSPTPPAANPTPHRHTVSSFYRRRPLFWITLAFCSGIALDAFLAPRLPTVGGLFLACTIGAFGLLATGSPLLLRRSLLLCGCAAALASGMLADALRSRLPAADDIASRTTALPSFVWVRGTILEANPSKRGDRQVWLLSVAELGSTASSLTAASGRIQIVVEPPAVSSDATESSPMDLAEGDRVELRARLEAPPEVNMPDSFDYASYLASTGIRRTGMALSNDVRWLGPPLWWRPDLKLRRFSAQLSRQVETLMADASGASGPQAALLNALLFGRRDRVDPADREAFAISGTAHLLAIAGLHIQFLVFLLWIICGWIGIPRRKAALLVMAFACAYCALAGANVPILRATLMIVLYLAALLLWREADPVNVLSTAALLILLWSPAELFRVGFQLSFLAVLALATLYPALEETWIAWRASRRQDCVPNMIEMPALETNRWEYWRMRLAKYLRSALLISLVTWLGTAPAIAWHMGRFSTLNLALNLLSVPLNSLCMLGGLIMLALSTISHFLATLAASLTYCTLLCLEWINQSAAALPFASINLPAPTFPILLLYVMLLASLWVARDRHLTPPRVALLIPLCFLVLLSGLLWNEAAPAPTVTILALNRGRAALIEAPAGGAAMLDAGAPGEGAHLAELLRRRGRRTPEFASHLPR